MVINQKFFISGFKSLMKLSPRTAQVIKNGEEVTVSIDQVKTGDVFVVRPGENIPVDGVVIDGNSAVNLYRQSLRFR